MRLAELRPRQRGLRVGGLVENLTGRLMFIGGRDYVNYGLSSVWTLALGGSAWQ